MDFRSKAEMLVSSFFESKKNSNCLLELEELLLVCKDEEDLPAILDIISDTFSKIFSSLVLPVASFTDKQKYYKLWLLDRYDEFISHIFTYLSHCKTEIQVAALETLMTFVKLESKYPCRDETKESPAFPVLLFKRIVSALASDVLDQNDLIEAFEKYTIYDDVKLYILKFIEALLKDQESSDICLQNSFSLLCSIEFPKSFNSPSHTYSEVQFFQLKEKSFRKLFSSVWSCFLNRQLSASLMPRVLTALNENVLPHLQNPCLLTDFLTSAYQGGGILSLLALKGLFILMEKYNLEYPDFFVKLYALLDPSIINGKFSPRFFYLCNLFLSSTHLPAHIIASFIKKLARVSLISSATSILKIIGLISVLLSSHPSLEVLIHRTDAQECSEDCFDGCEEDPAQSRALNSCLWEIKTLETHIHPDVSCKAKELMTRHPKFTLDASKILNMSLYDLYLKHRKRKFDEVPLSIYKPLVKKTRTC